MKQELDVIGIDAGAQGGDYTAAIEVALSEMGAPRIIFIDNGPGHRSARQGGE